MSGHTPHDLPRVAHPLRLIPLKASSRRGSAGWDGDRALYLMEADGSGQTRVWPENLDWVVWFAGIDHRTG